MPYNKGLYQRNPPKSQLVGPQPVSIVFSSSFRFDTPTLTSLLTLNLNSVAVSLVFSIIQFFEIPI